jgi:hypothetical protein
VSNKKEKKTEYSDYPVYLTGGNTFICTTKRLPPIQCVLGAHSRGQNEGKVGVTTRRHPVPRSRMTEAVRPFPLYDFMAVVGSTLFLPNKWSALC